MTEGKRYKVEKTRPETYLDNANEVVTGFSIRVRLFDYDEIHDLQLPNLNPETVKAEIEKLLADRDAVNDLG